MKFIKLEKYKIFLMIVSLLIISLFIVRAQEKTTPYKIVVGASLGGNFYISDFTELKGYPSCCTNYDFASGFGYSAFIGGEYIFDNKFFGIPYTVDLLLAYNNLSSKYAIEEKLANVITGNDYIEAFSEHILDTKINSILLEPGINLYPFNEIPLNIRFGFKIGLLSGMTFTQEERILSPDWITYKETGTKIKYHYEGDIPDASQLYSAITLGMRYEVYKSGNFSYSPILNLSYGLNDIVSGLDWKVATVQAGVSISYNIPEAKEIPTQDSPLPKLPLPPKLVELYVDLNIEANNHKLNNNDTLYIQVKERKFINRFILLPIVFYKMNSGDMLTDGNTLRSEEEAQKHAYKAVILYLKENPNVNVTLISSSIKTESPEVVKKRIEDLKNLITKDGIGKERIRVKEIVMEPSKIQRTELNEDKCFVRFDFSDGTNIIPYRSDTVTKFIPEPVEINIEPKVKSDVHLSEFTGNVSLNKKVVHLFKNEVNSFNMRLENEEFNNNQQFHNNQLKFFVNAKDEMGTTKSIISSINLKPEIISDAVFENVITDFEQRNYVRQFTLGYCEFDKAEFIYVDKVALEEIKKAVKAGEIIEIIPLFDFMGTEEHNYKLAAARANSALTLIGIKQDEAQINIPKDYFFSNENPYSRMMNRTVIVRLKNISVD